MRTSNLIFLLLSISTLCFGANDPYLTESKVYTDLDNLLSRLFTREQFVVAVNAKVAMRSDRRLVEGEIDQNAGLEIEPDEPAVPVMPGFSPEAKSKRNKAPSGRNRQLYRMVESPYLDRVYVQVSVDEKIEATKISRARLLVENYLQANYPNEASLSFSTLPMLQPVKEVKEKNIEPPKPPTDVKPTVEPPPADAVLWRYARWTIAAMIFLLVLLQIFNRNHKTPYDPLSLKNPSGMSMLNSEARELDSINQKLKSLTAPEQGLSNSTEKNLIYLRKHILEQFLSHSLAFKEYYGLLDEETRGELYSSLKGPAFDSLLDSLRLKIPATEYEASEPWQILSRHEENFEEFSQTKAWQDRQFFGFLNRLPKEQLITLASRETTETVCLMLRMMRAEQSAIVLDSLPPTYRREVLASAPTVNSMSFSDMASIEKRVRDTVHRMPVQALGAQSADAEFWGAVVSESAEQEELLGVLEKTQPEIYPFVKKFKFKLEDAAALPEGILTKVLSDIDNDPLALALATCSSDVSEVILEAVPKKRRDFLKSQIISKKGATKDEVAPARALVTRKIREALA